MQVTRLKRLKHLTRFSTVGGGDTLGMAYANSAGDALVTASGQAYLVALDPTAIARIPGCVGYWPASPEYLFEDSAGYTPASVSGVVGQVRDISQAATPVARRNLLTYSEQFDSWNIPSGIKPFGIGSISNAVNDPTGSLTADLITESAATGGHYLQNQFNINFTSGTVYTYSFYAKQANGTRNARMASNNAGVIDFVAVFDINSGTVVSGASATITNIGNGWWRCSATRSAVANSGTTMTINIASGTSASYLGDGTSGIYIWGAQLELGGEATPYQKIVTGTGDVFAPGNHAYQQTTSKKPILRTVTSPNGYWCDGDADDALNVTLSDAGLGRRNLLTYSEEFSNSAWVKTASSITPNAAVAPDGTLTADVLIPATGTSSDYYVQQLGVSGRACGIYAKAGSARYLGLANGNYGLVCGIDLIDGSITYELNASFRPTIIAHSNGWFRVSLNSLATDSNRLRVFASTQTITSARTVTGDGTSGIYIWGAQLELGASATDYQRITSVPAYLTVARATASGVTFAEGAAITSPYNLLNPYDANDLTRYSADVAIFNRALTTCEKAIVKSYMQRGVPLVTNGGLA